MYKDTALTHRGLKFARPLRRWLSAFALAVVALPYRAVADPGAVVEKLDGVVEKRPLGAFGWERLYRGEHLDDGASVRTQARSTLDLKTGRGHRLHLRENSTLELTSLQDARTEAHLEIGSVLSTVKHLKKNETYAIQTPTAVCAVRGTQFETRADADSTWVAVFKGVVGVTAASNSQETAVHAGQMTSVHGGSVEMPHPIPGEKRAGLQAGLSRVAHHEVALDMSRNQVIAAAAAERRLADYQEGKTLVDASGNRVRLEEYIMRPQPDQFKFVVLNERGQSQLDYFYYLGTFNKTLPTDLSVALKQLSGTVGTTAPDYYLTAYDTAQSNTQDSTHDTSTGGHLVKVSVDGSGNYVLTDPTSAANTHTITAAQLQSDGTYKVYDPLADSFSVVSAAQLSAATHFGVYIPENDSFKDLAPGDTLWKTRFNTYDHSIDNVLKQSYAQATVGTNVLSTTLDANWTYAGGFVLPVVQADPNNVDVTITDYYGDGTFEQYRTLLIDNLGNPAPLSAFSGISTGAAYHQELLQWNYEQQVSATEFQGRKLDLVVEPRIFIESGLIQ